MDVSDKKTAAFLRRLLILEGFLSPSFHRMQLPMSSGPWSA